MASRLIANVIAQPSSFGSRCFVESLDTIACVPIFLRRCPRFGLVARMSSDQIKNFSIYIALAE